MLNAIPLNKQELKTLVSSNFLLVILISTPSAIIADYLNIPLAWMIGPMIVISIVALKGVKILMPRLALSGTLIILGLHIGPVLVGYFRLHGDAVDDLQIEA